MVVDIANNKKHSVRVKKSNVKKSLPMARDASRALVYFCWCWVPRPKGLVERSICVVGHVEVRWCFGSCFAKNLISIEKETKK